MASIWKLDGTDLYVDSDKESLKPTIAELNPINSTASVFHNIFVPTVERTIEATVIGETNKDAIQATRASVVTLISDLTPSGISVLVTNVDMERQNILCQFVDTTLPSDSPVYRATVVVRPQ